MGKRKSKRAPVKKNKVMMEREFNCLFCNHERCIEVKIDRKERRGTLRCSQCSVEWSQAINSLSEATDVYHAWIDAIEAANKDARHEPEGSDHEDEAPVRRLERQREDVDSDDEGQRAPPRNRDRDSSEEPLMDPDALFPSGKKAEAKEDDEDSDEEPSGRKLKRAKIDSDSEDD